MHHNNLLLERPHQPSATAALQADTLPTLVAQVYAEAPPLERGRLLEHLLAPLGLLSLAAVADGVFSKITLVNGWGSLKITPEDAKRVGSGDVVALVSHVQQVSVQAIEGLSKVIATSPVLAGSAAAAMLLAYLAKQSKSRAPVLGNDYDPLG